MKIVVRKHEGKTPLVDLGINGGITKIKFSLCFFLTKHHAMKAY
jgi:hypothetical protein